MKTYNQYGQRDNEDKFFVKVEDMIGELKKIYNTKDKDVSKILSYNSTEKENEIKNAWANGILHVLPDIHNLIKELEEK